MTKKTCARCGSERSVGDVKTMSPRYGEEWDEVQKKWIPRGFHKDYAVCMGCIIKLEAWLERKDQILPGQTTL